MARLICDNADRITTMQRLAFQLPTFGGNTYVLLGCFIIRVLPTPVHYRNALTSCQNEGAIPRVNLSPWRDQGSRSNIRKDNGNFNF